MGRDGLKGRAVWQDYSGANAGAAERSFYDVFVKEFDGTDFTIRRSPTEFSELYVNVKLTEAVLAEIYNPVAGITKHGVRPDYAIGNKKTKKTLYVEVKRQDGWVEDKPRSAGRGNAHERSCKYFTPGLLRALRSKGGLGDDALPFWTVFQGDIARDPCRVREITLWFDTYEVHFFMWRSSVNAKPLLEHFNIHLKHLLL